MVSVKGTGVVSIAVDFVVVRVVRAVVEGVFICVDVSNDVDSIFPLVKTVVGNAVSAKSVDDMDCALVKSIVLVLSVIIGCD